MYISCDRVAHQNIEICNEFGCNTVTWLKYTKIVKYITLDSTPAAETSQYIAIPRRGSLCRRIRSLNTRSTTLKERPEREAPLKLNPFLQRGRKRVGSFTSSTRASPSPEGNRFITYFWRSGAPPSSQAVCFEIYRYSSAEYRAPPKDSRSIEWLGGDHGS